MHENAAPLATPEEITGVESWMGRPFPHDLHGLWSAPPGTYPGLLGPFEVLDLVEGHRACASGVPFFRTPTGKLVRISPSGTVSHPVAGEIPGGVGAFAARASDTDWLAALDLPRPQAGRLGAIAASTLHRLGIGSAKPFAG